MSTQLRTQNQMRTHTQAQAQPQPQTQTQTQTQTQMVCDYIAGTRTRQFPADVLDEAKKCLVDWVAVCVGAYGAPEASIVQSVLSKWGSGGNARLLEGGTSCASVAGMINATLSHCLDYDDTHIPSVIHVSGPMWAALLAVGSERRVDESILLKAFITGFELAARIGDNGIGIRMNNNGWHSTPAMGRVAVTAALAVVVDLKPELIAHALGIAATQASGLTAAFGTMSKPLQIGKTAMDAVLSIELAEGGLTGPVNVLDAESSFVQTMLQYRDAKFVIAPFDDVWEIKRNSFKAYAACQLTHAAIDAARAAGPKLELSDIESVSAHVNPLALKIANIKNPRTTTEAKFSMAYCVALGLRGFAATMDDFEPQRVTEDEVQALSRRVESVPDESVSRTSARLDIALKDGRRMQQVVEHALGSIGNPLSWGDIDAKFLSVVKASLGSEGIAGELLRVLKGFERGGSMTRLFDLSARK